MNEDLTILCFIMSILSIFGIKCDMNCMAYDGGICKMMEGNK